MLQCCANIVRTCALARALNQATAQNSGSQDAGKVGGVSYVICASASSADASLAADAVAASVAAAAAAPPVSSSSASRSPQPSSSAPPPPPQSSVTWGGFCFDAAAFPTNAAGSYPFAWWCASASAYGLPLVSTHARSAKKYRNRNGTCHRPWPKTLRRFLCTVTLAMLGGYDRWSLPAIVRALSWKAESAHRRRAIEIRSANAVLGHNARVGSVGEREVRPASSIRVERETLCRPPSRARRGSQARFVVDGHK